MAALQERPREQIPAAVELKDIDKRFGQVHANKQVNLAIARGSIHGIVGENGAGKSTLMSILYGFYEADSGSIWVNGQEKKIRNSADAIRVGIGMVHQHFMLVDSFSVLENIMLGAEDGHLIDHSAIHARQELSKLEKDYGLKVDPDALIADLPVGEQQRVEILKALYRKCDILILDEPTGVLTPQETDQLFRILASLKARGVTVILITHKLREIMAITDHVTVMRQGEIVADRKTSETNPHELAELMVGKKLRLDLDKMPATPMEEVLKIEHLTYLDSQSVPRLDDISFNLRKGEIVGIAGVSGNGQSELLEVLSGIRGFAKGKITINQQEITPASLKDPAAMRGLGLAHVPEDRHKLGLVTSFPAWESSILGYQEDSAFNRHGFLKRDIIEEYCKGLMEKFDVRPRQTQLKSSKFSGGNQQKLILAREMSRHPDILLVGQPTRGVDIGAIQFIHRQLIAMRDQGCAVLLVSVELEEIMALSDRILVMFQGKIVGEVAGGKADERELGLMMTNAHKNQKVELV